MSENSGGDVNYYRVEVAHPKRTEPYVVECEDIIGALGMDFFEGEAFKAAWRKAAQRTLGVGKEGNTALRDAQKMAHYGARCLAIEENRSTPLPETDVPEALPPEQWLPGDLVKFLGEDRRLFKKEGVYQVSRSPIAGLICVKSQMFVGSWTTEQAARDWAWQSRPSVEPAVTLSVRSWQKGDVVRNVGGGDHWTVGADYRVLGIGHGTVRVSHEGVVPHWIVFSVAEKRFQWVRSGD